MSILPRQPEHFRVIGGGTPLRVQFLSEPPTWIPKRRPRVTGARAEGIRYENRVHAHFAKKYGQLYVPSPWFAFEDLNGKRWCQPDGLLVDIARRRITVIEMKYNHTGEAWWKLVHLYLPVLQSFYGPGVEYRLLEVVRWYDPLTLFPDASLCADPVHAPRLPAIGVHICKPRTLKELRNE